MIRLAAAATLGALVLAACGGGVGAEGAAPTASASGGLVVSDELPPLDLARHEVPLEDVHFDTFDGGSLPLSEASADDIRSLLDRIPPLDDPAYVPAEDAGFLADDDLVLGYEATDGSAWAYPIRIMNFHEIVNDDLGGIPVLVSYCPLCRSGVVYDRRAGDRTLSFGNTSALYESDLVMYDRETNSYWWQVAGRAIVGTLSGTELEPLPSVTTTWADWRGQHPETAVLSLETGFDRPYERDPFRSYQAVVNDGSVPFPVDEDVLGDARLEPGTEVLGVVVGEDATAYPLAAIGDAAVNDEVGGRPVVVLVDGDVPTGATFDRRVGDRTLTFTRHGDRFVDGETGTAWDRAGRAVDGPLAGEQLEAVPSRFSFWFAFLASFPDADVHRP